MADIGPMNVFSAGQVASSEEVMENFYNPGVPTPNSFEAVNGLLDEDNVPPDKPFVTNEMVRPNSMCRAEMTGLTGNLDYQRMLFAATESEPDSFLPIPGASKTFYLPIVPSLMIITWQITLGNSMTYKQQYGTDGTDGNMGKLKFFLDGVALAPQTRELPACCDVHATYSNTTDNVVGGPGETVPPYRQDLIRYSHRDRTWSGHVIRTGESAGWHTAHLGLYINAALTRVRVRNLKIIWFR